MYDHFPKHVRPLDTEMLGLDHLPSIVTVKAGLLPRVAMPVNLLPKVATQVDLLRKVAAPTSIQVVTTVLRLPENRLGEDADLLFLTSLI